MKGALSPIARKEAAMMQVQQSKHNFPKEPSLLESQQNSKCHEGHLVSLSHPPISASWVFSYVSNALKMCNYL